MAASATNPSGQESTTAEEIAATEVGAASEEQERVEASAVAEEHELPRAQRPSDGSPGLKASVFALLTRASAGSRLFAGLPDLRNVRRRARLPKLARRIRDGVRQVLWGIGLRIARRSHPQPGEAQ